MKRILSARSVRFIACLIVFTFSATTVVPSQAVRSRGFPRSSTLSPEVASNPIDDTTIKDRNILGALIMNSLLQDQSLPGSGLDMASYICSKMVNVAFSAAKTVSEAAGRETDDGYESMVVPCRIDDDIYFAYLVKDDPAAGFKVAAVHSRDEYNTDLRNISDSGKLPADVVEALSRQAGEYALAEGGHLRYVDETDESVGSVMSFFRALRAEGLVRRMENVLEARRLLIFEGPAFIEDSIVIDAAKDTGERAAAILSRILARADIDRPMLKRYSDAFNAFLETGEEFDVDRVDPMLRTHAARVEEGPECAYNEGGLLLKSQAYTHMPDVSWVVEDDMRPIVEHIKSALTVVARHDMEEHNRTAPESARMSEEDIPEFKVVLTDLSKGLLPTMRISGPAEDGTVTVGVNRKFVKMLAYLTLGKEIWRDKARIHLEYPESIAAYLHISIIYQAVIHEVRGHLPINEAGKMVFDPDESRAQSERGRSYRYVNTLAMLFYLLVVAERTEYPEERARQFLEEYPEVLNGLSEDVQAEWKKRLPEDLGKLCRHLMENGMYVVPWEVAADGRVFPVRMVRTGTDRDEYIAEFAPGAVPFDKGMPEGVDEKNLLVEIFDHLRYADRPVTAEHVSAAFVAEWPGRIRQALELLKETGAVALTEEGYRMAMMLPGWSDKVEEILKAEDDHEVLKGDIGEIVEAKWAHAVLDVLDDMEKNGRRTALYLETEWIPEEQRMVLQQLIQGLKRMGEEYPVDIIVQEKGEPAGDFARKAVFAGLDVRNSSKNFVYLGSREITESAALREIRGKKNAVLVGVDKENLDNRTYVRLVEMLRMSLKLAHGGTEGLELESHPDIEWDATGDGVFVFKQRPAEPIDLREVKKIYEAQRKILFSA